MRGYFGIGIFEGKSAENVGGLWRSAHALGASMIFTIGYRPPRQPTDTTCAAKHVPLFHYADFEDFEAHVPANCKLVGVETRDPFGYRSFELPCFAHPERALYLLGAEDRGLDERTCGRCHASGGLVTIPSALCLNVATAGSIVMYDRLLPR